MKRNKLSKARLRSDSVEYYTNEDALILIMGPSGVGKSTFINNYSGETLANVTHAYKTCTRSITPYKSPIPRDGVPSPKKQLVLIDTPGFFGGEFMDLETLHQIRDWLRPKNGHERHLTGIIYLHDMTQKRMVRETQMSLSLFQKICGTDSCSKTVLVKTQWPKPVDPQHIERAEELDNSFFKEMKEAGAKCMDIRDGITERKVVEYILTNDVANDIILKLQQELREGKAIPSTGAGQELRRCLNEMLMHTDPGSESDRIEAIRRTIKELNVGPSLGQKIEGWIRRTF